MRPLLFRLTPGRVLLGWLVAAVLVAATLGIVPLSPAQAAGDPCGPDGNEIACENSKPGTPMEEWDIWGAGDDAIQGFATDISVNVGNPISFKIDTDASNYDITIYRTGYYGGDGAREIATVEPSAALPQQQPACITDPATELYDCGNWGVSATWNVPSGAVSGVYVALLKIPSTGESSHITFVVRDDSSQSDIVFQTADPTWQAYNTYGGSNFYQGAANGRAYKISYNRPVLTRGSSGSRDFYMSNEYAMVRFLERNGYDVSYIAGVDSDRNGHLLTNHKTFVTVGHDEYWSGAQRANVEAARDAGVNLMFLTGNEVYWRTRYEPSADSSHTPYRTLVSYKETWGNAKIDPSPEWTGTWRDPRFAPTSSGAGSPENALIGTQYMVNFSDLAMRVPAAQGKLRLWRHTSIANLTSGAATLAPHTVGYESNEDVDNGHRPEGLIRLSTTTGEVPEYLQDYGNTVRPGTTTHHMTMYRASSGALVFSAGTVQWAHGLDDGHDSEYPLEPPDVRMQQAQVNLLADMDAQPTTLASNLVQASKSTDTAGPTVTITSPDAGADVANGTAVTTSGTATDSGGGVVAGVEVSTDGGSTWHPAEGTSPWSYTYLQRGSGATSLQVRAIDDSANIGTAATRTLDVSCPCTVYGQEVPETPALADGSAVELGLRFAPTTDGFVKGIRYYRGSGNNGTHVGTLWTAAGQKLASATFTDETATGWQLVTFPDPVAVTAGQTYVASYTAPTGHYAAEAFAFTEFGLDSTPLQVAGGFSAAPAGVYGAPGQFPSQSYNRAQYFVDVSFVLTDDSPLRAQSHWPVPGTSSVPSTTTVSATFSKPVKPDTVSLALEDSLGQAVPGATTYDATTRTVTFTPDSPLAGFVEHTAIVGARDALDLPVTVGETWSFTTARPPGEPGVCPCSLFDDTTMPEIVEVNDPDAVTLGVRFTPSSNGTVTGVRFYKGPNNAGTHVGTLWSANGAVLARGTFTDESVSGWQDLVFDTPVEVSKNQTYVASYRTTVGRYSATLNAFSAADLSRPPLSVTSTAGAYSYADGFPGNSSQTNYLVDVVFEKAVPQIAVASQSPAAGALDVALKTPVKTWFSAPVQPGYTMAVESGGVPVPGTATLTNEGTLLTFRGTDPLPLDSQVDVTLSGVVSTEGAVLPTQTWSFHTRADSSDGPESMFVDELPEVESVDESSPVELGTAFTPSRNGHVTAVRFFKGPGNGGTHTGSLWSADGSRLATVTFTDETPTGWQDATLSTPVRVNAGQTYVVSYFAPQGHYSYTSGFFSSPWTSGNLTAPSTNNGRYIYGSAGGFPAYTFGATNYFVDVQFVPEPPTISITERSPEPGATGVARGEPIRVGFSAPIVDGYAMQVSSGGVPVDGDVTLSDNRRQLTFRANSLLPADADIDVDLVDVVSDEGVVLGGGGWTFRTEPASDTGSSMFLGLTPATPAADDTGSVELGTAFTTSEPGDVTAIRFYKGAGNSGTHVGSLWTAGGQRLATVTFADETATGWQKAKLDAPVPLTPGETYVVSYFAPNGRYSYEPGFFSSPWTAGPLTASTANGRYGYGSGGGFPANVSGGSNYFVDVVFRAAAP
jgi:hypothetical protein